MVQEYTLIPRFTWLILTVFLVPFRYLLRHIDRRRLSNKLINRDFASSNLVVNAEKMNVVHFLLNIITPATNVDIILKII